MKLGAMFGILLGLALLFAGLQEYVDGSCATGDCRFSWGFHDPIFVILGAALAAVSLLVLLGVVGKRNVASRGSSPDARRGGF